MLAHLLRRNIAPIIWNPSSLVNRAAVDFFRVNQFLRFSRTKLGIDFADSRDIMKAY